MFNIETEVSCFSINGDEKVHCLKTKNYLQVSTDSKASSLNRLVFLPTDSVNMPIYKVLVKSVEFVSAADETLCIATSEKSVDGFYSANVLNRGYNCFSVDILGDEKSFDTLLANSKYIKISLDIISVFNVKITATFYVHLHGEKDTSNNPDKKFIPDLKTYTIHHSNYQIEDKTIVTADWRRVLLTIKPLFLQYKGKSKDLLFLLHFPIYTLCQVLQYFASGGIIVAQMYRWGDNYA